MSQLPSISSCPVQPSPSEISWRDSRENPLPHITSSGSLAFLENPIPLEVAVSVFFLLYLPLTDALGSSSSKSLSIASSFSTAVISRFPPLTSTEASFESSQFSFTTSPDPSASSLIWFCSVSITFFRSVLTYEMELCSMKELFQLLKSLQQIILLPYLRILEKIRYVCWATGAFHDVFLLTQGSATFGATLSYKWLTSKGTF